MTQPAELVITGGEAIVRSLERHGVDIVFGIPGEHNIEVYRALGRSAIRHVASRHEQGAGFMADGYARVSGRPGVCIVVTGPGLTNVATPMAQAFFDAVPLLVLSGQIRSDWLDRGGGHFHELKDQLGFTGSLLGWSEQVTSVSGIPRSIDRAMQALGEGSARGVHLEFPQDILHAAAGVRFDPITPPPPPALDASEIDRATRLLATATRPAIIAGGGARHAGPGLLTLAERIGAPVLTTWRGAGAVPRSHPLAIGAGLELAAARSFLQACDLVLVVGSELSQIDFFPDFPGIDGVVVQVDRDPSRIGRACPVEVGIVGDAGAALAALSAALGAGAPAAANAAARAAGLRADLDREAAIQAAPYRAVIAALRAALPADAILACDLTGPTYWAVPRFFPVDRPDQVLLSGIGTLGYALPGAIGAKFAAPERPVAVVVGDGGFMFSAPELMTAAEHEQNLILLLWNNRGFGDIRRQLLASGANPVGVDLASPDFVGLAEACGGVGVRLDDPRSLPDLVQSASRRRCPTLIEVVAAD